MPAIARFVKFTAQPGQGDALATEFLAVAEDVRTAKGCRSSLIHRETEQPDVVWVSERWAGQEAADAALHAVGGSGPAERINRLCATAPEVIELEPLGGLGVPGPAATWSKVAIPDQQDRAPERGLGETGSTRPLRAALGAEVTGATHYAMNPGMSHGSGHRHDEVEEIYVILSGTGELLADRDTVELAALDAVRVSPTAMRMLRAGDEGVEVLAFGTHLPGDGHLEAGWRA